jgi:hypothetical protein
MGTDYQAMSELNFQGIHRLIYSLKGFVKSEQSQTRESNLESLNLLRADTKSPGMQVAMDTLKSRVSQFESFSGPELPELVSQTVNRIVESNAAGGGTIDLDTFKAQLLYQGPVAIVHSKMDHPEIVEEKLEILIKKSGILEKGKIDPSEVKGLMSELVNFIETAGKQEIESTKSNFSQVRKRRDTQRVAEDISSQKDGQETADGRNQGKFDRVIPQTEIDDLSEKIFQETSMGEGQSLPKEEVKQIVNKKVIKYYKTFDDKINDPIINLK